MKDIELIDHTLQRIAQGGDMEYEMEAANLERLCKLALKQVKNCVLGVVSDWVAVSDRLPEVGVEVWAVTDRDSRVRKIVWGTGDEAFYEYWMVLNRPEPPYR